jgi:enoyl-CoA hydratase
LSAISSQVNDGIALIRLNQPANQNVLSVQTLRELESTVTTLSTRPEVKSFIFTGTGNVSAAGADLAELSELDQDSALAFSQLGQRLFQHIAGGDQITIAAINGYCMGGGLDLALACDIRVASSRAVFSHPGARRGIITGWGGTQRLPKTVGRTHALEMFITAGRYSSEAALAMGLITAIEDPVEECALRIARTAAKSYSRTAQFPSDNPQSFAQ